MRVNFAICIVILVFADVVISKLFSDVNDDNDDEDNTASRERKRREEEEDAKKLSKKRKKGNSRSTSSSEGQKGGKDGDSDDADNSLDMSDSGRSVSKSGDKGKGRYVPQSTEERTGWRKWHRKCTRCLEDERKKWRDPTINWICGAYQQARRSFKSECMMFYRNCQDGTMFIKIRDHRCPNDTGKELSRHGDHFFYEYMVNLLDEDKTDDSKTSEEHTAEVSSSY